MTFKSSKTKLWLFKGKRVSDTRAHDTKVSLVALKHSPIDKLTIDLETEIMSGAKLNFSTPKKVVQNFQSFSIKSHIFESY